MTSAPKKGVSPGNQNEVRWASDKIDDTQFSNISNPVSFLFKWKSCLHLQMGRISSSLSKDLLSFCIPHPRRNHRTVSSKVNAGPMMWRRRDNSPTQPHSNHKAEDEKAKPAHSNSLFLYQENAGVNSKQQAARACYAPVFCPVQSTPRPWTSHVLRSTGQQNCLQWQKYSLSLHASVSNYMWPFSILSSIFLRPPRNYQVLNCWAMSLFTSLSAWHMDNGSESWDLGVA